MTRDSIVTRSSGFIEALIDGEIVAMSIDAGACFSLNKVGSRVWALIAEPRCIGDICNALTREYDVDDTTCEDQVTDLLRQLLTESMIEIQRDGVR